MLGLSLLRAFAGKYRCVAVSRNRGPDPTEDWRVADLLDTDIRALLTACRPDVVVHCAAITSVDQCESNPQVAQKLHVRSTEGLAEACRAINAQLVYISTDSVFDGAKEAPYTELDRPQPLNVYANTKLDGERSVLAYSKGLVLRTNIFGWRWQGPASFSEWILAGLQQQAELTMFTDVMYSPIASEELARVIDMCIERDIAGLYHAGGGESLSKYDFSLKVARAFSLPATYVRPIKLAEKELVARRPANMALDSSALGRLLGKAMPDVDTSIHAWMDRKPNWKR